MIAPTPRRRFRRLRRWVLLLGLLYVAVVVVFMFLEDWFVFRGNTEAQSWHKAADPRTVEVEFRAADGTKLHARWLPPTKPDAGAFLYAHGNGGNVSHYGKRGAGFAYATGAGVLLFDYPGYGRCDGKPTEKGCYAAGDAAYAWLTGEGKVPPNRVILLGESLGSGVAVDLATRHDHRALVLMCTFTSLPAAAKSLFP